MPSETRSILAAPSPSHASVSAPLAIPTVPPARAWEPEHPPAGHTPGALDSHPAPTPLASRRPFSAPAPLGLQAGTDDLIACRILDLYRSDATGAFLRFVTPGQPAREYTYKEMVEAALPWADLYDRCAVPTGGTVLLMLEDSAQVFLAMAGAMLSGRVPAVIAHPSPKMGLADFSVMLLGLIDNAQPQLLVGEPKHAHLVSQGVARRVATPNDLRESSSPRDRLLHTHAPLFLQYSSGTTGAKKGVAITGDALLWQVDTYARAIGLTPQDHIASWLPLYHDMGLITSLMMPLLTGVPVTLMSPFAWISQPAMLLRAISQHRATLCWLPNFAFSVLSRSIPDRDLTGIDLSSLRGVVNCSEPVLAATHDHFVRRFAPFGLRLEALASSFAMAENTFAVTSGGFNTPLATCHVDLAGLGTHGPVREGTHVLVSSGTPLPGVDLRVVDASSRDLPDRHIGEILIRSPSLMSGYHRQDDLTRRAFQDSFFATGDLGFLADGELYVTGRKKDLIIIAGRNIHPQDVEAVVNDVPGVLPGRCVALGVHDNALGTECLVVIAESATPEGPGRRRLEALIAESVARRLDLTPRDVRVVDHRWLAKSTSGKISRNRNRERYLALETPRSSPPNEDNPAQVPPPSPGTVSVPAGLVARCVAEVTRRPAPNPSDSLLTSGLIDSLGLVNLLVALEKALGRSVPSPAVTGFEAFDTIAGIEAVLNRGTPTTPPRSPSITDRQIKASYYLATPRDFDLFIFGSSRTYAITAATAARFGYRPFHLAVNAAKAEDLFCLLSMVAQHNRVPIRRMVVGLDPEVVRENFPMDVRLLECRELTQYLEPADREGLGPLPHELNGTNEAYREGNLKRYELRYREWGKSGTVFDPKSGDLIRFDEPEWTTHEPVEIPPQKAADPETLLLVGGMSDLDSARLSYLDRFIRLAHDLGAQLDLYINPLHPHLAGVLAERTRYLHAQARLIEWLQARQSASVRFLDLSQPGSFGGRDGDFYHDGRHLGCFNADLLLHHLLHAPAISATSVTSRSSSTPLNTALSPSALETLCADRSLDSVEPFPANDFYGNASILKRYCGLPASARIQGIIPHGAKVASKVWQQELDHPLPNLLLWSEQQRSIYAPQTRKAIHVIGSPLLYAARLIEPELDAARRQATGTIVFPVHSTHHLTAQYDEQEFIARIAALPPEFHPIHICLYWRDVQLGRHHRWLAAGFPCLSAGHMYDPEFAPRLLRHICSHRFAATNRVGTASLCASVLGLPVAVFPQVSSYSSTERRFGDELAATLDLPVSTGFASTAGMPIDQVQAIQRPLADHALGVHSLVSPAELRHRLESLAPRSSAASDHAHGNRTAGSRIDDPLAKHAPNPALEDAVKALHNVLPSLQPRIGKHPRRQPGTLDLAGHTLAYADLHSAYYQADQIFNGRLYALRTEAVQPRILDCGAHIGLAALFFAHRFPDARIESFEADPAIARLLARNVASLGMRQVVVHPKAVWTHNQGVAFQVTADDSGHLASDGAIQVPSVRLRDLLLQDTVDLLKLDIEGAEYDVLKDCDGALARVRNLVIEAHQFRETDGRLGDLLSVLERNGFVYTLGDLHAADWISSPSRPPFEACSSRYFIVTVFAWNPSASSAASAKSRAAAKPARACSHAHTPAAVWTAMAEGVNHLNAGRNPEALAAFDRSLRLDPTHHRVHLGRSLALARSGRRDEARTALARVTSCEPGYAKARQLLIDLTLGDA